MLGFRFIKTEPTHHVIAYRNGHPVHEGTGLAFWYFAATTSIVVVPTGSVNEPFIFPEVTQDFQDVTVQGQVTYRIADPKKTAALLNFSLDAKGSYASDDPAKLSQRVIDDVQVVMRAEVKALTLQAVLGAAETLVDRVAAQLRARPTLAALGVEILGLSVLAVKPKPETAKALEAGAREALLQQADDAIYARRNAAVENERTIKQAELTTEQALQERRLQIQRDEMVGRIDLEERNKALVALATANGREEADAKAYGLNVMMKAFETADPKVLQALASVGMEPGQLMALAFRDLADNATKIGQLNVTPDLLKELLAKEG